MQEKELKNITATAFFKLINKNAIEETLKYIATKNISLKKSTKYSVIIKNEPFPPKDFIRIMANLKGYAIDESSFFGGKANKPFEKLGYKVIKNEEYPFFNGGVLQPQIKKYQNAIENTDWLNKHEVYKFNFIKWIEDNIDFENDSNEIIKSKIEESQQQTFSPDSNAKGVNFIQTITRYQDDFITLQDIEKLRLIIKNKVEESKESLQLSFGSFPKTSAFLCLFAPEKFMAYDGESIPAYEFLSKGINANKAPKRNYKAFQFYQIFYKNVKEHLKTSHLNTDVFRETLKVEKLTELHWNFITQDFLLYITRQIMNNSLQKKYDEFVSDEALESWDWYQNIKLYSQTIYFIKENCKNNIYKNYQDLNTHFKKIVENENEDFLQRYLFEARNGFSDIRQQLIKIDKRTVIINKVNKNFKLLEDVLIEKDLNNAFNLVHNLIEGNNWSVIYRFLRALFPNDLTSVDAPNHFDNLTKKINSEFGITLNGTNQIEKNQEILALINFKDIYKAQIFFWIFKEENQTYNSNNMEVNVINEFAEYLLNKAPKSYTNYLGSTNSDILIRLNEINSFFEIDLFLIKNSDYSKHISLIKNIIRKEEREINDEFNEYDQKKGTGIPKAILGKKNYLQFLKNKINNFIEDEEENSENQLFPLNQILYGPPGTGKTYKTKELAVNIIDGFVASERDELLKRYEELVEAKQIHFTTFHQSMSYEDFIEGIKPKMNEENNDHIEYEIRTGLFKEICELAKKKQIVNFEEVYKNLVKDITESDDEYLLLKTPREKEYRVNVNSNDNLSLYTSKEIKKQGVLSKNKLQKQFEGENVYEGWEGYANGVLNYLEENYALFKQEETIKKKQVLIIDEINRGNVSAIFGELITLIEDDKRAGNKETIHVTLPYSQEKFSVPNNVYIIGTMNTADRSVEALDTALRRRFSFAEILPKPILLSDLEYNEVHLESLLETINQRIELLIDKDHQIGHSYFFKVTNLEDLKTVFKDKIIPLLEEYFYGDLGKIGLVLGENFIEQQAIKNKTILANFKSYDDIDFISDKKIFRLKPINEMDAQDFISIYQNILQ